MEFLSNNEAHFSGLTESFGKTFEKHCERLTNMGVWATVTELTRLAAFLHVPVYVLTEIQSNQWTWRVYRPPINPICSSHSIIREILPPPPYHIELAHVSNSHFDRVVQPPSFKEPVLQGKNSSNTVIEIS